MQPMPSLLFIWVCSAVILMCGCGSPAHPCSGCRPPAQPNNFVYTANAGGNTSSVSALSSDPATGKLSPIADSPYPAGSGSRAIAADPAGKFLYVANEASGDISGFAINSKTGALTALPGSPFAAETGIASLTVDPQSKFLYVSSGNTGNLWTFSIDAFSGALTALAGTPAAVTSVGSPSSVLMHPSGKYLFVTDGNTSAPEIFGFARDATSGTLSPLPDSPGGLFGFENKGAFDPGGTTLFVTGTNTFGTVGGVDVLNVDISTGHIGMASPLAPFQVGTDPSGVVLDPTGKFVYIPNTADATISAFTFDNTTGVLTPIAGSPFPSGGKGSINGPLGIAMDQTGRFLYVCNASNDVSVFTMDSNSGALSAMSGSPFPAGGSAPSAIVFVPGSRN